MVLMRRLPLVCCLAFVPALLGAAARAEEPKGAGAEEQIRDVVRALNLAWQTGSAAYWQGVLSSKAYALAVPALGNPDKALVLDRDGWVKGFEWLMANQRPKEHRHEVSSISVFGPLAVEIGVSSVELPTGARRGEEVINLFALSDEGWRMYASVPAANVRKALQAVPADRQAVLRLAAGVCGLYRSEKPVPIDELALALSDDVVSIDAAGVLRKGKAAALAAWQAAGDSLRERSVSFEARLDVVSVRMLADGAVVVGRMEIFGRPRTGDAPLRQAFWKTLVFERTAAGWRIAEEHTSAADPSAARP